jgi:hypothetical protein
MMQLKLQPEFEDLPSGEKLTGAPAFGIVATACAAARNDERARGARRRIDATRLDFSSDDGFHLFRVY